MQPLNMETLRGNTGTAPWLMPPGMALQYEPAPLRDIPVAELGIFRLHSATDICHVAQLRRGIDLSAAASADPDFLHREKKETNWAWSMPSSCMAS